MGVGGYAEQRVVGFWRSFTNGCNFDASAILFLPFFFAFSPFFILFYFFWGGG